MHCSLMSQSRDVALAYEVLSDPKKRKVYDQNGEDALTICGRDPMDLFKSTFEGHPFGCKSATNNELQFSMLLVAIVVFKFAVILCHP